MYCFWRQVQSVRSEQYWLKHVKSCELKKKIWNCSVKPVSVPQSSKKNKNKHRNTKYITNPSSFAYKLILNLLHDSYLPIVLTLCNFKLRKCNFQWNYKEEVEISNLTFVLFIPYIWTWNWACRSGFVLTSVHRPETFSEKTFLQVTQHFSFLQWINVQTLLWQT